MRRTRHLRRITTSRLTNPRVLPPELLRRLEVDPVFQVMTGDRQYWIEPYTGTAVPASLGRLNAAREFLIENESLWRNGQSTMPVSQLEYERWRKDLIRMLPAEPRLRIFARGGIWLNPYSGEFVSGIPREDGKITFRTVSAMAQQLCLDTKARDGRMLEPKHIAELLRSESTHVPSPSATPVVDEALVRASNVQRQMLPELPSLERFAVAVHYAAHHGVSGDFYDFLTLPDGRLLMVVGDVSGHGLQAGLVVATALKTLRFVARSHSSLQDLLSHFNDEIKVDLIPGQFMTLVALALDQRTGEICCIRAGHHPGLLATLSGETILKKVGRTGMAIGLATGRIFAQSLREERLMLQPGDVLLHYTDGLTEAMRPDETAYGEARLYASLLGHIESGTQQLADAIAQDVSDWAGGPVGDDVTVLVLEALIESQMASALPAPMPVQAMSVAVEPLEVDQETEVGIVGPEPIDDHEPSETGELEAPAAT